MIIQYKRNVSCATSFLPLTLIAVVLSMLMHAGQWFLTTPEAFAYSTTYTVQPGDSLYSIGLKFGVTWQSIADANKVSSPYTIYPGQILLIPANDPLATANTAYDKFDSYIVKASQKYGFSDAMAIKSMMMQESAFHPRAVSQDIPCGVPAGWTPYQSHSFGLLQVTPACMQPGTVPNLTTNHTSSMWSTSWFNPRYNTFMATELLSTTFKDMKSKFSGCSSNQYTLMAIGAYNSGEGAIYGCGSWDTRADGYITAVLGHYQTFAQMASLPYPY